MRLHGVLNGFDTPTLRGVWDTAPYLHDGSAATLTDVLNNSAHGNSASLSSGEREQLVAYLLQIDGEEPAAPSIANAATITSLNFGQTVTAANIPLTLNTTLNNIEEVQWVVNDMPLASVSAAPYSTTWAAANVTKGLQRVYARVVYNNGLTATLSPEVTINYQPAELPVGPPTPLLVELRVEIEGYVNHYDTTQGNAGSSNTASCSSGLGTNVDIHSEGSVCAVGWVKTGEWLDYTIDVPQAGEYDVSFRYSNAISSQTGIVEIRTQNGSTVETATTLGHTGGWGNYQTQLENNQRVTLIKGTQTIRMYVLREGFNLDYFDLKAQFDSGVIDDGTSGGEVVSSASSESNSSIASSSSNSGTSSSSAGSNTTSDLKVQAEDYTNAFDMESENKSNPNNACNYKGHGVDVGSTGDAGGGCHVGWIHNGEWLDYSINLATAGEYRLTYRFDSGHTGDLGAIHFKNAAGALLSSTPVSGDGIWGNFSDVQSVVHLPAGQQTVRLEFEGGGYDINWFNLELIAVAPKELYQAEDYVNASDANAENKGTPGNGCIYRGLGVDVTATGDSGGGCHVGWSSNGEWLEYVISPEQAGEYKLTYRYASGHTGSVGAVQFQNSAGATLNRMAVEGTGVWGQFHDLVTTVSLDAGQQTIRLYLENPGFDLNWFKLEYVDGSVTDGNPPTDTGSTCGAGANDVITVSSGVSVQVVAGSCLKYTVNNGSLQFGSWDGHAINYDIVGGQSNITHGGNGWASVGQPRGDVYIKINSVGADTLSVMLNQW